MSNKKIIISIVGLIILCVCFGGYLLFKKDSDSSMLSDSKKFAQEYTLLNEDNVFVYKSAEEIINILEKGTGIVYLGFPECPWCQAYVVYLNEVAQELGIEEIYYFNILEDRKNNTESYQKMVEIIGDHLQYDDNGNPRIFVPDVSVVKNGLTIGHDYETSNDTGGFDKPEDYWTNEKVSSLKAKLKTMMSEIADNSCTECNNK